MLILSGLWGEILFILSYILSLCLLCDFKNKKWQRIKKLNYSRTLILGMAFFQGMIALFYFDLTKSWSIFPSAFLLVLSSMAILDALFTRVDPRLSLGWTGLVLIHLCLSQPDPNAWLSLLINLLFPLCLVLAHFLIKNSIGNGDAEILLIPALYFSVESYLWVLIITFLLGGIYACYLLVFKKKKIKDHLPLGPFVWISAWLVLVIF